MDPIQLPESVGGKVRWRALLPIVVHVVTHVLNFFRHKIRANRLVLITLDFNSGRTPITGIRTQAVKSDSMQIEKLGRPELDLRSG